MEIVLDYDENQPEIDLKLSSHFFIKESEQFFQYIF
jgi:hypothetical protein